MTTTLYRTRATSLHISHSDLKAPNSVFLFFSFLFSFFVIFPFHLASKCGLKFMLGYGRHAAQNSLPGKSHVCVVVLSTLIENGSQAITCLVDCKVVLLLSFSFF